MRKGLFILSPSRKTPKEDNAQHGADKSANTAGPVNIR